MADKRNGIGGLMMKLCRLQELGCLSDTAEAKRRCGRMTAIVKDNRIHSGCPDCGWSETEQEIAAVIERRDNRREVEFKGTAGNAGRG